MCAQVDNIMVPTRHCFFADRGMRFKHIWFHRPHQQNSNAAVCDHWQPSVATLLIGACNSNTFGFINLISKIATQLHMITVLQQHVLWFLFRILRSSDLISLHNISMQKHNTWTKSHQSKIITSDVLMFLCSTSSVSTTAHDKTWATLVWLRVLG